MGLSGIPERIGFEEAAAPWVFHRRVSRSVVPPSGTTRHEVERNLAILTPFGDISTLSQSLRVHPIPLEQLSDVLRSTLLPLGSYVVLVPGSVWATKRWSPRRYQELARRLEQDGVRVVLVGAPDERESAAQVAANTNVINLVGQTSIEECVSIIASARGIVCNDSFALHVASAARVPTVAVFCATSPEFGFGPWHNPMAAVAEREGLSCKPCSRHGQPRCPLATNQCMEEVPSSQVYAMLERLMKSSTTQGQPRSSSTGLET
jgi:heptosyltransferase-2